MSERPLRVVVTGACSDIAQNICYMIAKGDVFGPDGRMELVLMDNRTKMKMLNEGLVVELGMCNLPLVQKYSCTDNMEVAFKDADAIFLCKGTVHQHGLSRNDFIGVNSMEYKGVGEALEVVGVKKEAKILVVIEPVNIILQVLTQFAPSIDRSCIMGLSRELQNRSTSYIARMLDIASDKVSQLTVWGSRFLDVRHAQVERCGRTYPAYDAIKDDFFLKYKFVDEVLGREAEIEKKRKSPPCLPKAVAAVQHMAEWVHGSKPGNKSSMIVFSDGSYGIPEGMPYSFPVHVKKPGQWEIVQGLDIVPFERERLDEQASGIRSDIQFAFNVLGLSGADDSKASDDQGKPPPWSFGAGPVVECRILSKLEQDRLTTM